MELNSYIEHTNLEKKAKEKDIQKLCEEAKKYHFSSICIHPFYVSYAKELLKGSNVQISTVIGYPFGMNTKEGKVYEAIDAITNGADEIEMCINISMLQNKEYDYVKQEIEEVRDAIDGKICKIIVDTEDLTEKDIIKITEICNNTFVHFLEIPNHTKKEDVETIIKHKNEIVEVKVYGNIETEKEVEKWIHMGISKIGTTNSVKIMKGETK